MRIVVMAATLMVAACSKTIVGPMPGYETRLYQLTPNDERVVHAVASRPLFDPNGAQFRELVAGQKEDGSVVVCGFINGKNRFGGYVGFRPFVGYLQQPGTPHATFMMHLREHAKVYRLCAMHGLPLVP